MLDLKKHKEFLNSFKYPSQSEQMMIEYISKYIKLFSLENMDLNLDTKIIQGGDLTFSIKSTTTPKHILRIYQAIQYMKSEGKAVNFLDVGSGVGTMIALAKLFGADNSNGIEYDKKLEKYTKDSIRKNTFYINAFDFENYKDYNFIYLMRPIVETDDMNFLLETIDNQLKPGSLILSIRHTNEYIRENTNWVSLTTIPPVVYEKI